MALPSGLPSAGLAWIADAVGSRPGDLHVERLPGSTSSDVYRITHCNGAHSYVLRLFTNARWLQDEPDLPAHEAAALREAAAAGLPAPRLVAVGSDDVGLDAPAVLMSHLAGSVNLKPADFPVWLDALAAGLAAIHRHRPIQFPWRFSSWVDATCLTGPPIWTNCPALWELALTLWQGPAPDDDPVFLHRDFHPANVLWQAGRLSGVVDWVNACVGPAGVDVAHCRLNLALAYGIEAARRFLHAYERHATNYIHHPYWDVDAVLNGSLPSPVFYEPWQQFGLPRIPAVVLQRGAEALLADALSRLN